MSKPKKKKPTGQGKEKPAREKPSKLFGAGITEEDDERCKKWAAKYSGDPSPEPETLGDETAKPDASGRVIRVEKSRRQKLSPKPPAEPPQIPTAMEQLRKDGLPEVSRESLDSFYGFADWRLAACLVVNGKNGRAERAELAEWLIGAVEREDAEELRAFARCLDAMKGGRQGSRNQKARALALHFCRLHRAQTGRDPSQVWVRRYLVKNGFSDLGVTDSTMRKNEAREIFFGPVLGCLQKAKGGRPKPPSRRPKR